jgi:O-antigen/teichoic acid export membrane protein
VRKTWSLVALTSGSRVYWVLASLLTTVITARFLGPEGRGVYVAAIAWVMLFSTLGNLSLSQVVVYLAAGRPKESWLGAVTGSALSIVGVLTFAGWACAAILYAATQGRVFQNLDGWTLIAAFAALPMLLWLENGNSLLMALGKLSVMNASQMIGATVALALTFVAVGLLRTGIRGALVASAMAQAVTVAIALVVIVRTAGVVYADRGVARELLHGGVKLHLNAIGTYLFTQANVLILNHYRTPEETFSLRCSCSPASRSFRRR